MKPKIVIILMIFLLGLLVSVSSPVNAQQPQPTPSDNEVNAVAKQMYCPVCENIPLDVCPTPACQEWRELIRLKLSEGYTEDQIKEYFAAQYGDRVLAEPPRRGLNWLVYVLPWVFLFFGAVLVFTVLRSMRKPVTSNSTQAAAGVEADSKKDDDPYLAKLEEELHKKPE